MENRVDLLVTVVLAAGDERAARQACQELRWHVDGRIVEATDCSAEEPGCWSVTMRVPTEERATHQVAAPLARAVRQFVRNLGPAFPTPRVACEPPTAWTVLDDPDAVDGLVSGAERLLVEAWCGGDPYPPAPDGATDTATGEADPSWPHDEPAPPEPERVIEPEVAAEAERTAEAATRPVADQPNQAGGPAADHRLTMRVDVATARTPGAEWQARALASRISRTATLTGISEGDGVVSVHIDLGRTPGSPSQAVLTAVSALDRQQGWSALRWSGDTAITSWVAQPRPAAGITGLELACGPAQRREQ